MLPRLVFPAGLTLALISIAIFFFFGADSAPASLTLSAAFLGVGAASVALGRTKIPDFSLILACLYLAFLLLAYLKGWLATGAPEYASLAAGGAVFLIARSSALKKDNAAPLWTMTLALGGLVALAALINFAIDPASWLGRERPYHVERLSAPFLSANTAGTFYGLVLLMGLASLLRAFKRIRGLGIGAQIDSLFRELSFPAIIVLLSATALALTASRAGIVTGAVLGVVLVIWERMASLDRAGNKALADSAFLILTVTTLGAMLVLFGELFLSRLERVGRDSETRRILIETYWQAVRYAPVFGHGLGGFRFVNDLAMSAQNARVLLGQGAAHNVYLQWLLQGGVAGSAAMFGAVGFVIFRIYAGLMRRRRGRVYLRAALLIALLVATHGLVDYALEIPGFMWFFAWVLGLSMGMADAGRVETIAGLPARRLVRFGFAGVLSVGAVFCAITGQERVKGTFPANDATAAQMVPPYQEKLPRGIGLERLIVIGDRALRLDPPAGALAVSAFERAAELEPRSGEIWARLSYARLVQGEDFQGAASALSRSFLYKPYAERAFRRWRLDVAARLWPYLPPEARSAALREARLEPEAWRRRWMAAL